MKKDPNLICETHRLASCKEGNPETISSKALTLIICKPLEKKSQSA